MKAFLKVFLTAKKVTIPEDHLKWKSRCFEGLCIYLIQCGISLSEFMLNKRKIHNFLSRSESLFQVVIEWMYIRFAAKYFHICNPIFTFMICTFHQKVFPYLNFKCSPSFIAYQLIIKLLLYIQTFLGFWMPSLLHTSTFSMNTWYNK